MNNHEVSSLLRVLSSAAHITLENGGETYRAEDIVLYIAPALGADDVDIFATPTGIIITVNVNGESHTTVKSVKKRTINLNKINSVNDVSRGVAEGRIGLLEAEEMLAEIHNSKTGSTLWGILAAGLASGFFTVLFGGSFFDFAIALLAGGLVAYISEFFERADMFHFMISLTGGAVVATVAALLSDFVNIDKVIVGGIMPLLPGLAMTNAIRDTMKGDLVSGTSRLMEALLRAVGIATGVGIVLSVYSYFGRGMFV